MKQTSILSEEMAEDLVNRIAAAAATQEARAAQTSTGILPTSRRQANSSRMALNLRIPPALAASTGNLVTSHSSVSQTVLTTKLSVQQSRETGKGADVSERGDPLLLNNIV